MKKVRRGDFDLEYIRPKLEGEISDIAIYLDLLAKAGNVDLAAAIIRTFNAKSDELGIPVRIE